MNNNLEFENEDPSPDSIEDNHPRTNYGEGYYVKETLEEAAEKYADFSNDYVPLAFGSKFNETTKRDFIEGAKWQQKRMFSEVIEFAEWVRNNPYVWNYPNKLNDKRTTEELFEQFKKGRKD